MWPLVLTRTLTATAWNILTAPIWWYTGGLIFFVRFATNALKHHAQNLALALWLKNLFTPMFGQYDFAGRLISFFVRLANIIGRGIALALWGIWYFILFLFWVFIPLIIVLGFIASLVRLL